MQGELNVVLPPYGTLQLVRVWGSDEGIVEAARMSTGKGFKGWGPRHTDDCNMVKADAQTVPCSCTPTPGDEKLLRYLWDNKHATPFEMAGAEFEVKAPIMVFREWQRHRTQSFSEMSARYEPLPDDDYVPHIDRVLINAGGSNKQAGTVNGAEVLTTDAAQQWLRDLQLHYDQTEALYQHGLKIGIPKELARLPVSVGRYSKMRAATDLRNWLAFLTLRNDKNAQWEIRQFAIHVEEELAQHFPRTLQFFRQDRSRWAEFNAWRAMQTQVSG